MEGWRSFLPRFIVFSLVLSACSSGNRQAPPVSPQSPTARLGTETRSFHNNGFEGYPFYFSPAYSVSRQPFVQTSLPAQREPIHISAEEYSLATEQVDDPEDSLNHFYQQLEHVAHHEQRLLRISVYGDSTNGTEYITSSIREAFQKKFGDGGKGWVPIAPGWPTQFHQDVVWRHYRSWFTHIVNRGNGPGDRYGLGGVLAYSKGRHSRALFQTTESGKLGSSVSSFRLFYQTWRRGGTINVRVDDGEPQLIETMSEQTTDRVWDIDVPDGQHSLRVGVEQGRVRLYGVVMEREGPGVVVDGLMLIGARGRRLALFDEHHIADQVRQRETDLLVFWLGANDAESPYFNRAGFLEDYGAGIDHARAGRPEASCLVVSIMDLGEVPGGRTLKRVPRIVETQQQLARDHDCAFLNMFEAIGGRGTMRRWYRARPRLAHADYTHLTPQGAENVGQIFYQTLLRGFAEYLGNEIPN